MLNSPGQLADIAPLLVRESLPVIERAATAIPADERRRLTAIAESLLDNEPALNATAPFGEQVAAGIAGGAPAVVLADHSEIALYSRRGDLNLEYRMLLLAHDGDLAVIGAERNTAFEAYCRDKLGLGQVTVLALPRVETGLRTGAAKRCRADKRSMATLAAAARDHGALTVLPYMGTGEVWMLATDIARETGAQVRVAAAPPRLVRRVNDKIWFAARIRQVLGASALPPSYSSYGPAALAARVAALARRYPQVVVKLPDSASGSGNLVLRAADLQGLSLAALRHHLIDLLTELGWPGTFPLLAGVWDASVLANPSAQLWLPPAADGAPIVEGLFDQRIEGAQARFVGATLSDLPMKIQNRLANEAARLGFLLQQLGYYGRCSLDAVIVGEDLNDVSLHWIECNGRWGGTSLPMTVANRLAPNWPRRAARFVQQPLQSGASRTFAEIVDRLEQDLFVAGCRDRGIVFLSPGVIDGGGLNLLILADSDDEADAYCRRAVEALL